MTMKINKLTTQQTNKVMMNAHEALKSKKKEIKGENNFDKITISSNCKQVMEKQFSEYLKNEILEDVKKPSSCEKLQAIEEAIAQGKYEINPDKIAEKILNMK